MKAALKNLAIVGSLVTVGFTHLVKADIESVTVIATHLDVKTSQLESAHQRDSHKVTSEYAEEIIDELNLRLPSQFENTIEKPSDELAEAGLESWAEASEDRLELASK